MEKDTSHVAAEMAALTTILQSIGSLTGPGRLRVLRMAFSHSGFNVSTQSAALAVGVQPASALARSTSVITGPTTDAKKLAPPKAGKSSQESKTPSWRKTTEYSEIEALQKAVIKDLKALTAGTEEHTAKLAELNALKARRAALNPTKKEPTAQ